MQQPATTLDGVRTNLAAIGEPAVSRTGVWRTVEGLD